MNNTKKNFYVIIGLSIFLFIFYVRIIRMRLPKDLDLFYPDIKWIFLFVTINSIIMSLFIIYKNLCLYFHQEERETIFTIYGNKISAFIDKGILEGYDFICGFHPHPYDIVSKIADIFFNIFKNMSIAITLWLTFYIKCIISIIFLIDIFIFFQFNYFYKSLFLLVIPLIFKIIFYILRDFSTNITEIEEFINVAHVEGDTYKFTFKAEFKHLTNIKVYMEQYILCKQIINYFDHYDYYSPWFTIRKNIIIYALFLIGWVYILIKNIFLLAVIC